MTAGSENNAWTVLKRATSLTQSERLAEVLTVDSEAPLQDAHYDASLKNGPRVRNGDDARWLRHLLRHLRLNELGN